MGTVFQNGEAKELHTLAELEVELRERRNALNAAEFAESHARNDATNARNALNDTQKKIDAVIEAYRTGAARDTHWGEERRRRDARPERAP